MGLFRSPETLSTLRSESADRFLRWREVERAVDEIHAARRGRDVQPQPQHRDTDSDSNNNNNNYNGNNSNNNGNRNNHSRKWSKGKWEAEWEAGLSRDVAQRLREEPAPTQNASGTTSSHVVWMGGSEFDPLHIPSLFVFSLSLFGPLTGRVARSVEELLGKMQPRGSHLGLALIGGFLLGVGVGLLLR